MSLIELDPFDLPQSTNTGLPISSIILSSNTGLFDTSVNPITGPDAQLVLNAVTFNPHLVFSVGDATGIPSMRLLDAADIPNIAISQVTGLQQALQGLVLSITSANAFLTVSNNSQGAYTLTVNTGTTSSTVAIGNDTRFPASVTGLRKGAGVGSSDTAATARTDYWDTTVFVASGGSHAIGLVPDPGSSSGTTRYLREDATWVTPSGAGTVTSVALTVPAEFSVSGSPVTTSGTLAVNKATQLANLIYAGPASGGAAAPTFRSTAYLDVAGIVGNSSSTIAAGNDTRFPASVTGLRKSSGAGSTDVVAVAKTDYWDTTVFGASGIPHSPGLVPDPGASPGSTRFLREDATWQNISVGGGFITNAMLANMPALTFKANPTGSSGAPQDVGIQASRTALGIESVTTFGDTNYTAVSTDKYVYSTTSSFSASRTVSLPVANTFNPGQTITIADNNGAIQSFLLLVATQGADIIIGAYNGSVVMDSRYSAITLASDGISKWEVLSRSPRSRVKYITTNQTYGNIAGLKALFVECVGGGGAGGGAGTSSSNTSGGGGGGSGAYSATWILSPIATYNCVIGVGGTGVSGANGNAGGDTSFGSACVAKGGSGGVFVSAGSNFGAYGAGSGGLASGGTGDIKINGTTGRIGWRESATIGFGGEGGGSIFGIGGTLVVALSGGNAGANADVYGAGGGGGATFTTACVGGNGAQGLIRITEFY